MSAGPALEMWSRQSGNAESQDGRTFSVSMQRAFTVLLDVGDPLEAVYSSAGLPLVGDLYPNSFAVFCTKLSPQRVSPIMAIVAADYSGETGPGGITSSPVGGEPVIKWGCSVTDEAIDEDWNGKPIVTKNNEPIDGITERLIDDVLSVERNFLSVNRYALRAYRRATNSDTFYGWPPGTCRMMDDETSAVFSPTGGIAYWRVRATFQFREPFRTTAAKAWYKRVRHEGYLVRSSASAEPQPAWNPVAKSLETRPVLLKSDGTRETNPDNAHWLEFQVLGSLPFNALGLS